MFCRESKCQSALFKVLHLAHALLVAKPCSKEGQNNILTQQQNLCVHFLLITRTISGPDEHFIGDGCNKINKPQCQWHLNLLKITLIDWLMCCFLSTKCNVSWKYLNAYLWTCSKFLVKAMKYLFISWESHLNWTKWLCKNYKHFYTFLLYCLLKIDIPYSTKGDLISLLFCFKTYDRFYFLSLFGTFRALL